MSDEVDEVKNTAINLGTLSRAEVVFRVHTDTARGFDWSYCLDMGYYTILRKIYKATVPRSLRETTADSRLRRALDSIKHSLQRVAKHDDVYDRAYYEEVVAPYMRRSAPVIARSIVDSFQPSSIIDVGCGSGELLEALREIGVPGQGLEYSVAALEIARAKGLNVSELDLEQPIERLPVLRSDLAVSTEVAEHLPEPFADTYVEYLCQISDDVLMTAATPGQGGTDHVNEQPNEYWIEKFASRNYTYQSETTERLRREWEVAGVAHFYSRNLLIFKSGAKPR